MKLILGLACFFFAMSCLAYSAAAPQTFPTSAGDVKITPLYHASTLIEAGGKTIYLDPAKPAKFAGSPKADLILITDIHPDHMDPASIAAISKAGTDILAPPAVVATVTTGKPIANGETKTWQGWTIEAIPAYNLNPTRGPGPGKIFHDKGRGNGYVLTYGGVRFYFSGDTEGVPENARPEEYRRGIRLHESALHHASRRGSGGGKGIPPESGNSVSLPRLRPHRISKAAGRNRDRSPFARLVPAVTGFRTASLP